MNSSSLIVLVIFSLLMYPMCGISAADVVIITDEVLPRIVHKSMVVAAGEASVQHVAIGQHHGTTIYTARFIDAANGIEQMITVASDGRIMYVEPFLFTAASSKRHLRILQNSADFPTLLGKVP